MTVWTNREAANVRGIPGRVLLAGGSAAGGSAAGVEHGFPAPAICAQIPSGVLLHQVAQYPAYTEAWLAGPEQLSL